MLFPTQKTAEHCRSFIQRRLLDDDHTLRLQPQPQQQGNARLVHLFISSEDKSSITWANLHIVLFPEDAIPIAKEFWQHTGLGISSRLAEKWLSLLPKGGSLNPCLTNTNIVPDRPAFKPHNRYYYYYYSAAKLSKPTPAATQTRIPPARLDVVKELNPDQSVYLEERYGRNLLPLSAAAVAKQVLRLRIAKILLGRNANDLDGQPNVVREDNLDGTGGACGITEAFADDVYLYPCGMAAIWYAHNMLLSICSQAKSICFGSAYCLRFYIPLPYD